MDISSLARRNRCMVDARPGSRMLVAFQDTGMESSVIGSVSSKRATAHLTSVCVTVVAASCLTAHGRPDSGVASNECIVRRAWPAASKSAGQAGETATCSSVDGESRSDMAEDVEGGVCTLGW